MYSVFMYSINRVRCLSADNPTGFRLNLGDNYANRSVLQPTTDSSFDAPLSEK